MKIGYTHIIVLLDRSGSMDKIKNDMIGGFNTFLQEQKDVPGDCTTTLVQFNDKYEVIYRFKSLSEAPRLTDSLFKPSGTTNLITSSIKLIDEEGIELSKMDESQRPEKVIFMSITDGEHNTNKLDGISYENTNYNLKEKIQHQENIYKWQFVYLGANQDAYASGDIYGVSKMKSMNFGANSRGIETVYKNISSATRRYRTSATSDFAFTDLEQKESDETV